MIFFPFLFGFCQNRLLLELIFSGSDYCNASTIPDLQKSSKITCLKLIRISYQLVTAVKYMHLKNFLHNDIKVNSVLIG